jgi:hypothetical protein
MMEVSEYIPQFPTVIYDLSNKIKTGQPYKDRLKGFRGKIAHYRI